MIGVRGLGVISCVEVNRIDEMSTTTIFHINWTKMRGRCKLGLSCVSVNRVAEKS